MNNLTRRLLSVTLVAAAPALALGCTGTDKAVPRPGAGDAYGIVLPQGLASLDEIAAALDSYDGVLDITTANNDDEDGTVRIVYFPDGEFLAELPGGSRSIGADGALYQYHPEPRPEEGFPKAGWYVVSEMLSKRTNNVRILLPTEMWSSDATMKELADGYDIVYTSRLGHTATFELRVDSNRQLMSVHVPTVTTDVVFAMGYTLTIEYPTDLTPPEAPEGAMKVDLSSIERFPTGSDVPVG